MGSGCFPNIRYVEIINSCALVYDNIIFHLSCERDLPFTQVERTSINNGK